MKQRKQSLCCRRGKNCFIQDGRESEIQWCLVWLMAAYEQAGQREGARVEFTELLTIRNKPTTRPVDYFTPGITWFKCLQDDPQIGRSLASVLDKSKRLGERYFLSGELCAAMRNPSNCRQPLSHPGIWTPRSKCQWTDASPCRIGGQNRSGICSSTFFLRQEAVTKEQIGEVLWPEIERSSGVKSAFQG